VIIDAINRGSIARYLPRPWTDDEIAQVSETARNLSQLARHPQAGKTGSTVTHSAPD
jgi:hypothetical protein